MKMKSSHAERISKNIEQNKILELIPYSMDAKSSFRSRSVNKEIQRCMLYKTHTDFEHFIETIDDNDREKNKWTDKDIQFRSKNVKDNQTSNLKSS